MWKTYVCDAHECCPRGFWKLWETLLNQTVACRDSVMYVVKDLIPPDTSGVWPRSTRTLRQMVARNAGMFWDHLIQTHTIDLRAFNLPSLKSVQFSFVDPVFVWIQRCNDLHKAKIKLHWDPVSLLHPQTGQEVFGAGIECGLLLREATATTPVNGKAALFNLSWDGGGTGYVGRSACPICIQVMNVNSHSPLAVGLIGYLPYVEVDKKIKGFDDAKKYVLQQCISLVLDAIESRARFGFR